MPVCVEPAWGDHCTALQQAMARDGAVFGPHARSYLKHAHRAVGIPYHVPRREEDADEEEEDVPPGQRSG